MLNKVRLGVGVLALVMTQACGNWKDALVVNACPNPVITRVSNNSDPEATSPDWTPAVTVESLSTARVSDVFADVGEQRYVGTAEITVEGQRPVILRVPHSEENPILVVIPASLCM